MKKNEKSRIFFLDWSALSVTKSDYLVSFTIMICDISDCFHDNPDLSEYVKTRCLDGYGSAEHTCGHRHTPSLEAN